MLRNLLWVFPYLYLVTGDWQSVLPWQVKTTLLELSDQFDIHSISGTPVAIYRKDLDTDYVAYWYININKDEYVILSSSPKTGDYKLVIQGTRPSVLEEVTKAAHNIKTDCEKFYMMTPTPDVNLACEDDSGMMIFAKNEVNFKDEDYKTLSKMWESQRSEVEQEEVWDQSILTKFQNASYYHVIQHGETHKLVVGDSNMAGIQLMNSGDISEDVEHTKLCQGLRICHPENQSLLDPKKFEISTYGQPFVKLVIPQDMKQNNHIYVELSTVDKGETVGRRLSFDSHHRNKRQTSNTFYSINDEQMFLDYRQHQHDCKKRGWFWNRKTKCCAVGCGPVAWAMVIGYYDRRSHSKPSTYGYGSRSLYNCGSNAVSGASSCIAPKYTDSRVNKLTEYLNNLMGTFCLTGQGATTQKNMKKFESYFKSHQKSGSPSVTVHSKGLLSLVGAYSNDIRNKALEYIRAKWPVVVGIRVSGLFSQHYPVATKYRQITKKECKKNFWGKVKCKTITQIEMFLHMGWGGSGNGWRPAKMFMAAVARY